MGLAALMSDLTSIFNSASTLFTIDIYQKIRKDCSMRELMIVGRLFVLVMIAISVIWVPIIDAMEGGQIYIYIQSIGAYLAPPIAAVYLLAILWKRTNEKGAFCSLMFGMVLGVTQLVLKFVFKKPGCGEADTRPAFIADFHYMFFAIVLFWSTLVVAVVVSLLTEAGDPKKPIRTTYWTRFDQSLRDDEHENLEMITTEGVANNGKMMMHFDHDDDEGKAYHQQKDVDSETSSHSSIETEEDICPEECCLPAKKDVNHNDDVENCH